MKRRFWSLILVLLAAGPLAASPLKLDSLKVGSRTYYKVTTIGANATDLYFTHTEGISNVKFRLLPPEIQKRFDYDPDEAAETERAQATDDQAYYTMLQDELTFRAQTRVRRAQEEASSLETYLADPISDRSLLGKTAPKLEVDRWIGERPFTAGKNVLVFFWTTWSKPSQKTIPALNAFQKQFKDRLVVVGISHQLEADVRDYTGPTPEFPYAVESSGKLLSTIGITSVPYAILVDTNGLVLYQGHPGALNETNLAIVLPPPPEE